MEVGTAIAVVLDHMTDILSQALVGVHVEQYTADVAHQTPWPVGNHEGESPIPFNTETAPSAMTLM